MATTKPTPTKGTATKVAPAQAEAPATSTTTTPEEAKAPPAASTAPAIGGQAEDSGAATGAQPPAPSNAQTLAAPVKADPNATRPYLVGSVPIRHDGDFYGVGYEIDLTDREADRLAGLVTPIPE